MKRFEGKKLLLLGSNVGTLDIIRYAKANGAYTIVADYLPFEKSLGKQYSDNSVLISTGDTDGLKKYITENKIDGVFAGISEFNLLKAMELCMFFGFPYYCNREQWNLLENKESFRRLCVDYDVPSPNTYFTGEVVPQEVINSIEYPVIVKPVDSSASVGITICKDYADLCRAILEARSNSEKGRIIIEEFFEGDEFTAHYIVVDGNVSLSCMDNRVPVAVHSGAVTTIPVARVYPSTFINEYIDQVNGKVINLCKSLNLKAGVLFVQGLYNQNNNEFSIFEAGLRCAGEAPYRIIEKVNGVNFMNLFVDYALLGKVEDYDIKKEDPYLKGKVCCVTSFVSKGGKVGKIIGYDDIQKAVPSIVDKECRYQAGDETPNGNTLRQIMLRFVLVCDTKEQLINNVERINQTVKVLDSSGDDLCYTFDIKNYSSNNL